MNGRRAFAPYPEICYSAPKICSWQPRCQFSLPEVRLFGANLRTAPLFCAATGLGQLHFSNRPAPSLGVGSPMACAIAAQASREAEGAWHMARTRVWPGFGIGGVILVAINIERRRNSDFVIYC